LPMGGRRTGRSGARALPCRPRRRYRPDQMTQTRFRWVFQRLAAVQALYQHDMEAPPPRLPGISRPSARSDDRGPTYHAAERDFFDDTLPAPTSAVRRSTR
jgi:hypothetical protein